MADNFDKDVQELSEEELLAVSGGKKILCPKGTKRVCGTRNGQYSCRCEPIVRQLVTDPQQSPAQ